MTDLDRSDVTHKLQRMMIALLVLRVPRKHDDTSFFAVHIATVDARHDPSKARQHQSNLRLGPDETASNHRSMLPLLRMASNDHGVLVLRDDETACSS